MKPISMLAVLAVLSMPAASVQAHHSGAMFDRDNELQIKGEIKEFRWTNPHVYVDVYATSPRASDAQVWSIEFTSPGNLARRGWNKRSLQPGDKVTMTIAPLRDGAPGGMFRKVIFDATGKVLTSEGLRQQTVPTE